MAMMAGPPCQGCQETEQQCAWNHCHCCEKCTHTFDGLTRKFICQDCGTVHTAGSSGNLPLRCRLCAARHTAYAKVTEQPAPKPHQLRPALPDRTWYVSYTGKAHLWGHGAQISDCGLRFSMRGQPAPDNDWVDKCGRCARPSALRRPA